MTSLETPLVDRPARQTADDPSAEHGAWRRDAVLDLLATRLKRAYHADRRWSKDVLETTDLRAHDFTVMSLVINNPGISQQEIADYLFVEKALLAVTANRLESMAWIERRRTEGDRRRRLLFATPLGAEQHRLATPLLLELDSLFTAALPEGERRQLCMLLEKVIAHVEGDGGH